MGGKFEPREKAERLALRENKQLALERTKIGFSECMRGDRLRKGVTLNVVRILLKSL